jgi:phage terminase small subunit
MEQELNNSNENQSNVSRGRTPTDALNEFGLTNAQEMFAQEYCVDFNATQAAIRAGYKKSAAKGTGNDLYKNAKVRARIKQLLAARRVEYNVNVERLQTELARIAFVDPTMIIEATGVEFKEITTDILKQLPARFKAAIKSIEMGRYGLKVVYHDKLGALDMLAKHLGFYEKDNEQKKLDPIQLYLPDNERTDNDDFLDGISNHNADTV